MVPNEVLTIIFNHLDAKQLLQCQLTNKQWRKASVKQLYSKVKIKSDFSYKRYINTVSTYPYLALYLKSIDLGYYFAKQPTGSSIRTYKILLHFPNITELSATESTAEFWTQLCYTADQGRFKYLQHLPIPSALDFEYYAYVALLLNPPLLIQPHNNAESLGCHWELIGFDNQLNYAIKKFPALKALTISLYSKEGLGLDCIYNRPEYTPSQRPSVVTLINFF
ncbi:hypothetical protein INT48_004135 [Thamnidium elegans]|uniref:F-box domain-containing protein n=1 Tax=Thamnidium elegans TaxID=101142 RepID=A0A8H7VX66_9FUNG|nr:hypothetical protein INT48_004135 [Thamnidium elegans]